MKKKIITGLLVLSVATASIMAFGPPKGMQKGFGPQKHIMKVFKSLDLSDAQKDAIKELRAEKRGERKAYKEQMREEMQTNVGTVFTKDGFNKTVFIEKATKGFEKKINAKADFIEKAYAILDETQKETFIQEIGNISQRPNK